MPDINYDSIISFCEKETIEQRQRWNNSSDKTRHDGVISVAEAMLKRISEESEIKKTIKQAKEKTGAAPRFSVSVSPELLDGYRNDQQGYTVEKMYVVLNDKITRGEEYPGVKFSKMLWVGEANKDLAYNPKKSFEDLLGEAKNLKEGEALVAPILSNVGKNKHWTASMFRKKNGKLEFVYNDPEGNPFDKNPLLKNWFGAHPEIEIEDLRVQKQFDDFNCGPYTLKILEIMAANKDRTAEEIQKDLAQKIDPQELRKEYAKILEADKFDRNETVKLLDELKERAVCGKMRDMFGRFVEEGRVDDKGAIGCDTIGEARMLAEQIKESYEKIGIKPCEIKQDGDNFVVKLPEKCRGKDPFKMNSEDLAKLKEEIKEPAKKVEPTEGKSVFNFGRQASALAH